MLWLLVLLLLIPTLAQGGLDRCDQLNRMSWLLCACLIAVGCTVRNHWAGAAIVLVALGTLTVLPRSDVWMRSGLPALAAAAGYAAFTPIVQASWLVPICWALVGIGCYVGLWTDYSRQRGLVHYLKAWNLFPKWFRPICWHEDSATHLKAGQGNANHLHSVACLCTAAMGALVLLGHPFALLAWPLVCMPMLRRVTKEHWLGQGHGHLTTGLVAFVGIWSGKGWVLLTLIGLYGFSACVVAKPWRPRTDGWDGDRFGMWRTVLVKGWWPTTWRHRLIGFGTGTWQAVTSPLTIKFHRGVIFTAAHNEWVQWLVEHGVIGLLIVGGYGCDLCWRLWHGGSAGQALLLLVIVLMSIATTNFPWTWFHQIPRPPECATCTKPVVALPGQPKHPQECACLMPAVRAIDPYYVGSPALNAMSLVLAILAEAF